MRGATTGVDICCELDNLLKKNKNLHLTSSCALWRTELSYEEQ
jgi:hypothetical protein